LIENLETVFILEILSKEELCCDINYNKGVSEIEGEKERICLWKNKISFLIVEI